MKSSKISADINLEYEFCPSIFLNSLNHQELTVYNYFSTFCVWDDTNKKPMVVLAVLHHQRKMSSIHAYMQVTCFWQQRSWKPLPSCGQCWCSSSSSRAAPAIPAPAAQCWCQCTATASAQALAVWPALLKFASRGLFPLINLHISLSLFSSWLHCFAFAWFLFVYFILFFPKNLLVISLVTAWSTWYSSSSSTWPVLCRSPPMQFSGFDSPLSTSIFLTNTIQTVLWMHPQWDVQTMFSTRLVFKYNF